MSINNFVLILALLTSLAATTQHSPSIFSYVSKQTDCGLIHITEATDEDTDIDKPITTTTLNLLANLSTCLNDVTTRYSLFTTHFSGSTSLQSLFNVHFRLDSTQGTIYLIQPIDREDVCQLKDPAIDCDCHQLKCKLTFKFLAFREQYMQHRSSRTHFNRHLNRHQTGHRTLVLHVQVKDSNDNVPIFAKNFFYANVSERIGSELVSTQRVVTDQSSDEKECVRVVQLDTFGQTQPNLIALEKAKDLDAMPDTYYTLLLLKNQKLDFVQGIESEQDLLRREKIIKKILENGEIEECNGQFELVETKPNSREFIFDNNDKVFDFDLSNSGTTTEQRELIFLKINAFLDREIRSVYNLILIANDRSLTPTYSISPNNYMLVRVLVTDLNDNSPLFTLPKYEFYLNEIVVDYKEFSFSRLLNKTCKSLRDKLYVVAIDSDDGLNGQVQYKLIQQVHRKNINFKDNFNRILNNELQQHQQQQQQQNQGPGSLFVIDTNTGQIYLDICQRLNTLKNEITESEFKWLTALFDHELYTKHILVVEASDSAVYSSLQTFVTVEIAIKDVNDHAPFVTEMYPRGCLVTKDSMVVITEAERLNIKEKAISIRIENLKPNNFTSLSKGRSSLRPDDRIFVSTRIVISDISELAKEGTCLGQIFIKDLDTPDLNGPLKVQLFSIESKYSSLFDSDNRLSSNIKLLPSTQLLFSSLGNETTPTQSTQAFEISMNWTPDFEKQSSHNFIISLRDSNPIDSYESFVHLIIELTDENDHAPVFQNNYFEFNLPEWFGPSKTLTNLSDTDHKSRFCLGTVQATDNDRSLVHANLTYEISDLEPSNDPLDSSTAIFYVQQNTGLICVNRNSLDRLDRERKSVYKFRFSAVNRQSSPPLRSSVLVQVNLNDLNDNRPEFSLVDYTFFAPEKDSHIVHSQIGRTKNRIFSVGRVLAVDKDQGINSQVRYRLQPGVKAYLQLNIDNPHNPLIPNSLIGLPLPELAGETLINDQRRFKSVDDPSSVAFVNETSGQVYLVKQFDREEVTHIHIRIVAVDRRGGEITDSPSAEALRGNEAALTSSVPVVVELIDLNDSTPECLNIESKPEHSSTARQSNQFALAVHVNYSDLHEATLVSSYPIYQLECHDLDLGKNSELSYSIERIYIRSIDTDEATARFNIASYLGSLSSDQRRALGQVEGTHDSGLSYLVDSQIFSVEPKSGMIYFNNIRSLWANNKFYQMLFFSRNLLIIRIKVSDNGMIRNSASFLLTVKVCVRDQSALENIQSKYCDWDDAALELKDTRFVTRRLENVEEELAVGDYADKVERIKEDVFYDDDLEEEIKETAYPVEVETTKDMIIVLNDQNDSKVLSIGSGFEVRKAGLWIIFGSWWFFILKGV